MSLTKRTALRLALLAGAACSVQAGAALAADTTTNVNSATTALVIPTPAAPDTATVNINDRLGPSSATSVETVVITSGAGTGDVVINHNVQAIYTSRGVASDDILRGRIDLSGISGDVDVNIADGALWRFAGVNDLGAGDDTLTIDEGGVISAGRQATSITVGFDVYDPPPLTDIDFGGGFNVLDNAGILLVGPRETGNFGDEAPIRHHEAEVRFENLDEFRHSGLILLGGFSNDATDRGTDRWYDDILAMPGTHFVGDGGEIVFDVFINGLGQDACDSALRDPDTGEMPAADCVALHGGSTEGVTYVKVNDIYGGDRGAYNPEGTVLVDVSGGTSAAGHFVLSPDSEFYSAEHGGVIEKGMLFYALIYDEDAAQHKLVGLAGANAMQLPLLGEAANDLWRLSAGSGMDRRAGLRGAGQTEGRGAWMRLSTESANRDVAHSTSAFGSTFAFDNTFDQSSYAVTGGIDLLHGGDAFGGFVLGLMAGYAHADVEFEATPNNAQFDSWTGGAYAGFSSGGLFLDAVVSAGKADMKLAMPGLDLLPAGAILDTNLRSVGVELEGAWRMPLSTALFIEPVASLSYVRTKFDDLHIPADDPSRPGLSAQFDDPTSLRAGLGARLGMDHDLGGMRARYSALGRVWNEFDGDSAVDVGNTGPTFAVHDEFTGTFTELNLEASLASGGGAVAGFVNLGGRFGDDYQATTASAGVRVNW